MSPATHHPEVRLARVIAITNQKGGVGKTTTAVNLGHALKRADQRVLLIDLDPQGHLTIGMGITRPDELERTVYNVLVDHRFPMGEVVIPTRVGVDLVPANIDLAGAEVQLVSEFGREAILKEKLAPLLSSYDFVIIDCPPSLGLLSINALVASGEVIIPLQCEYFAMKGMQLLFDTIDKVRAKLNPQLRISGILPTIFKGRTLHSQEVLGLVQSRYGELLYPMTIKDSIRFAESPVAGMSILEYAPASDGARSYTNLAVEVLHHG